MGDLAAVSQFKAGAAAVIVRACSIMRAHARNRGVRNLLIHIARENSAMLAIVRRAGADVQFDGAEATAQLPLPQDTLATQIEERVGHQAAELDYRFKRQVLRLDKLREVCLLSPSVGP